MTTLLHNIFARVEKRNFEYTTRTSSQGLYARHILRHLSSSSSSDVSVASLFERVRESFSREADACLGEQMAPEVHSNCRQQLSLAAPVKREASAREAARKFFRIFR